MPQILRLSEQSLKDLGFTKRRQGIFTWQICEGTVGWLGLGSVIFPHEGLIEINPVVGVRNQSLEKVLAELLEKKVHPYHPPSLFIHLGYLSPAKKYTPYLFRKGLALSPIALEMVDAVKEWGRSFMLKGATLESLCEEMKAALTASSDELKYRIPVALFLLGEINEAKKFLKGQGQALGARKDLAAQQYRFFMDKLYEALEA